MAFEVKKKYFQEIILATKYRVIVEFQFVFLYKIVSTPRWLILEFYRETLHILEVFFVLSVKNQEALPVYFSSWTLFEVTD